MSNETQYQERLIRIEKAINLEPVDRIPVLYMGAAFSPRYMGMSMAQFCADPEAALRVTLATMNRLRDVDGINMFPPGRISVGQSYAWLSKVAVPGRELPEDSLWQIQEAEVMTVEDYDTIINKGWRAFLSHHMPKILDMEEAQANSVWVRNNAPGLSRKFREQGFVLLSGGVTTIPFEYFCGGRSMSRFFVDLYRIPDKVKAAMDVALPDMIQAGLRFARNSGVPRVWVGGWRAASALVAPKIWDKLVFPYYYEMVTALAENGICSVLHFDQDWTRDLARLRELPAKKCILNPDGMTDVRKAKNILGDHMAILGDVPCALLANGTPDDVYNYVRDLVRDIGPKGLILCPGCDAPINTRPENMETFVAASRDFGSAV
ncbi:MAG: uroporphyrinogen-III decarboxylase [Candidatus Tectomicrobia bacterium]|uniref:Uroporphyrinogen-III decarboxylase n=1 Tax=Tectimicrobiota bacterium TaxID=2528274 RepID=A0A933GL06_UNCTE|nr:uroporphyrinogen-III decarboxylase [Candidatus Tectomicrobia bacterium]